MQRRIKKMDEFLDECKSKTIKWNSLKNLEYPLKKDKRARWEKYAEKTIKINPEACHRIALGLGYEMSKGVVCASITQTYKNRLALLNALFLDHKIENMVICIYNFSKETVSVQMGETFAFVKYLKQ